MNELAPCPFCGGIKLKKSELIISCEKCKGSSTKQYWPKAGVEPYTVFAWITTDTKGNIKITKDKIIATSWIEVGLKVETISDRISNHAKRSNI